MKYAWEITLLEKNLKETNKKNLYKKNSDISKSNIYRKNPGNIFTTNFLKKSSLLWTSLLVVNFSLISQQW